MAEYDPEEAVEFERLNAELNDSLERCRSIIRDCESKLAVNLNVPRVPERATAGDLAQSA